jgi:hypothetical protein
MGFQCGNRMDMRRDGANRLFAWSVDMSLYNIDDLNFSLDHGGNSSSKQGAMVSRHEDTRCTQNLWKKYLQIIASSSHGYRLGTRTG